MEPVREGIGAEESPSHTRRQERGGGISPLGKSLSKRKKQGSRKGVDKKVSHTPVTDRRKMVFGELLGRVAEGDRDHTQLQV